MFFAWGSPTFVICALLGWLVMNAIINNHKDRETRTPPEEGPAGQVPPKPLPGEGPVTFEPEVVVVEPGKPRGVAP